MRKLMVYFTFLLMGVLFFSAQQKSFAETTQENIDIASKAFDDGDCEKALKYYKLAVVKRTDDAGLYYNIGQCQSYLGQNKAAAASFEKYLDLTPDAEDTDEVNGWISDLKEKSSGDVDEKNLDSQTDESDQEDSEVTTEYTTEPTSHNRHDRHDRYDRYHEDDYTYTQNQYQDLRDNDENQKRKKKNTMPFFMFFLPR